MEATPKELEEMQTLVIKQVDVMLDRKLERFVPLLESADLVKELRDVIIGNEDYRIKGMAEKVDEMWADYSGAKWFLKNAKGLALGLIATVTGIIIWLIRITLEMFDR